MTDNPLLRLPSSGRPGGSSSMAAAAHSPFFVMAESPLLRPPAPSPFPAMTDNPLRQHLLLPSGGGAATRASSNSSAAGLPRQQQQQQQHRSWQTPLDGAPTADARAAAAAAAATGSGNADDTMLFTNPLHHSPSAATAPLPCEPSRVTRAPEPVLAPQLQLGKVFDQDNPLWPARSGRTAESPERGFPLSTSSTLESMLMLSSLERGFGDASSTSRTAVAPLQRRGGSGSGGGSPPSAAQLWASAAAAAAHEETATAVAPTPATPASSPSRLKVTRYRP